MNITHPRGREALVPIGGKSYRMLSDDVYLDRVSAGFEPYTVQLLTALVSPEFHVLDIGANIGCTTLLFGDTVERVDSFEPSPSTFSFLRRNVELAGFSNVELHNCGLGAVSGESEITFAPGNRSGGFVSDRAHADNSFITERITITTLDDFVARNPRGRLDFIKMDVEGYEQKVLEGGRRTIERFRPVVALELNHWCLNALQRTSVPDFLDFLRSTFPVLVADDPDGSLPSLHDPSDNYHVMYHHIIHNKYCNLIGAFDPMQIRSLRSD